MRATGTCKNCGKRVSLLYVDGRWYCARCQREVSSPAFCDWLFRWLGVRPGDHFEDLFPGSRAVTDAWDRFSTQGALAI
jgi:hypothetical protein